MNKKVSINGNQARIWVAALAICFGIDSVSAQVATAKGIFGFFSGKRQEQKDTENSELPKLHHLTRRILINSPVSVVWQTVHIERDCAPNLVYNNLLRADAEHVTYEQKWTVIPFLSTTTCQVDEKEIPNERIDFKLVKSDVLKRLEGSWQFVPADGGKSTLLTLDATIELKRTGPKIFMNAIACKKMDQRLAHVKELAEARHDSVQVSGQVL